MPDADTLLEDLQADVLGTLLAVPSLALAKTIADDHGDIEADVERMLGTMTGEEKIGLAIVILRPEVVSTEKNLPGPPLRLKIEIQVVENVLMNRDETNGTQKRSSAAALQVLAALHLHSFGNCLLYSDKEPVKPIPVKPGFVSDAVTLFADFAGISAAKTGQVSAEVIAGIGGVATGALIITGITDPDGSDPILVTPTDDHNGYSAWSNVNGLDLQWNDPEWAVFKAGSYGAVSGPSTAESPLEIESWDVVEGAGQPVFTAETEDPGQFLQLTCSTFGAAIYYTTDGSYPGAGNAAATLYTAPFALPEAGTVIRAAAYSEALNPSDVIEMTVV